MGSRLRHDLSDPIAMVAMIASALHEFGESLDPGRRERFQAQVQAEITRAGRIALNSGIALELDDLRKLVLRFFEDASDRDSSSELQTECARLIEVVGNATSAN